MAKNYVQQGGTIAIANNTKEIIKSGQLVHVGAVACVAITDIQPNETGDGFAEGVFLLNKKTGIALKAGEWPLLKTISWWIPVVHLPVWFGMMRMHRVNMSRLNSMCSHQWVRHKVGNDESI